MSFGLSSSKARDALAQVDAIGKSQAVIEFKMDGTIVTANQNPFPADYPYPVNGNFAPPPRLLQIRALLNARKDWRAADLVAVQKDVYSSFDRFLAGELVNAYERRNAHSPGLDEVILLLALP